MAHIEINFCNLGTVATGQHTCKTGFGRCRQLWQYYDSGDDDGLALNLSSSLPCSGTAVAWHFSFYVNVEEEALFSQFRVYRAASINPLSDAIPTSYKVVPGSTTGIRVPGFDDAGQYVCRRVEITQPFDVREGDILGVCLVTGYYTPRMFAREDNKRVHLGPASTHSCTGIDTINLAEWSLSNALQNIELLLDLEISKP